MAAAVRSPLRWQLSPSGPGRQKMNISNAACARLRHLQAVATWASAEVPPLGAFLGSQFASACEVLGFPPPPTPHLTCQRCESILQAGINCTIRVKNKKKKKSNFVMKVHSSINNILTFCHYCKFENVKRGTPNSHVKVKLSEMAARQKMLEWHKSPGENDVKGINSGLMAKSSNNGSVFSPKAFTIENAGSSGKRPKRKGWLSLKQLATSTAELSQNGSGSPPFRKSSICNLTPRIKVFDSPSILSKCSQPELNCLSPASEQHRLAISHSKNLELCHTSTLKDKKMDLKKHPSAQDSHRSPAILEQPKSNWRGNNSYPAPQKGAASSILGVAETSFEHVAEDIQVTCIDVAYAGAKATYTPVCNSMEGAAALGEDPSDLVLLQSPFEKGAKLSNMDDSCTFTGLTSTPDTNSAILEDDKERPLQLKERVLCTLGKETDFCIKQEPNNIVGTETACQRITSVQVRLDDGHTRIPSMLEHSLAKPEDLKQRPPQLETKGLVGSGECLKLEKEKQALFNECENSSTVKEILSSVHDGREDGDSLKHFQLPHIERRENTMYSESDKCRLAKLASTPQDNLLKLEDGKKMLLQSEEKILSSFGKGPKLSKKQKPVKTSIFDDASIAKTSANLHVRTEGNDNSKLFCPHSIERNGVQVPNINEGPRLAKLPFPLSDDLAKVKKGKRVASQLDRGLSSVREQFIASKRQKSMLSRNLCEINSMARSNTGICDGLDDDVGTKLSESPFIEREDIRMASSDYSSRCEKLLSTLEYNSSCFKSAKNKLSSCKKREIFRGEGLEVSKTLTSNFDLAGMMKEGNQSVHHQEAKPKKRPLFMQMGRNWLIHHCLSKEREYFNNKELEVPKKQKLIMPIDFDVVGMVKGTNHTVPQQKAKQKKRLVVMKMGRHWLVNHGFKRQNKQIV
ncbi:hypothetical protein KP509_22G081300 [Ceratopteris richardii]|uniref:Uncharacterized protein n=1 Tax=Ceratopteris richardii TaxID=49495 RepID=A0A8T2S6Y2_CERRI|nr:hypothetical protein KP509_22G081300 [Ceratopteris richardii]KAH7307885.1 hypothetical protein KP509_22G081300 [Ceratopteris richardii]